MLFPSSSLMYTGCVVEDATARVLNLKNCFTCNGLFYQLLWMWMSLIVRWFVNYLSSYTLHNDNDQLVLSCIVENNNGGLKWDRDNRKTNDIQQRKNLLEMYHNKRQLRHNGATRAYQCRYLIKDGAHLFETIVTGLMRFCRNPDDLVKHGWTITFQSQRNPHAEPLD